MRNRNVTVDPKHTRTNQQLTQDFFNNDSFIARIITFAANKWRFN